MNAAPEFDQAATSIWPKAQPSVHNPQLHDETLRDALVSFVTTISVAGTLAIALIALVF